MKVFIVLAAFVAVAYSQAGVPNPYSFNYENKPEEGGSSSHTESGDGNGRVSGSYSVTNLEGHNRVVEYSADENGFIATVRTNEPGTSNLNPANVIMDSSAPEALEKAVSYALGLGGSAAAAPVRTAAAAANRIMSPVARPAGAPGPRYVLVPATDPRARGY